MFQPEKLISHNQHMFELIVMHSLSPLIVRNYYIIDRNWFSGRQINLFSAI